MPTDTPSDLHQSPKERVLEATRRYGAGAVAQWCADLLAGDIAIDDPASPSLLWIGGPHAAAELRRGRIVERGQDYWPRTWAARALLYVWTPGIESAVVSALTDPAWRVREMAAKVVRVREIGEAAPALPDLVRDPMPRVRSAAIQALAVVGEGEDADVVREALTDADPAVRRAADAALTRLRRRLDRDL